MKIEKVIEDTEYHKNFNKTCTYGYWDSRMIKVVRKKDGTWTMGLQMNELGKAPVFYEIQLTEDNVPYVDVDKIIKTAEVDDPFIEDKGYGPNERVGGYSLFEKYPDSMYSIDETKSMFTFDKGYENDKEHFSIGRHSIFLNPEAVAIFVKIINLPEMKAALDERIAEATPEEIEAIKEAIKNEVSKLSLDNTSIYKINEMLDYLQRRLCGGLNEKAIKINLSDFAAVLGKSDSSKQPSLND